MPYLWNLIQTVDSVENNISIINQPYQWYLDNSNNLFLEKTIDESLKIVLVIEFGCFYGQYE